MDALPHFSVATVGSVGSYKKGGGRFAEPKLSAACFVVQSCLADADFVVFSNYCLIGTRLSRSFFAQRVNKIYAVIPNRSPITGHSEAVLRLAWEFPV